MWEVLANIMIVIIFQFISVSNQLTYNLMLYVSYISIKLEVGIHPLFLLGEKCDIAAKCSTLDRYAFEFSFQIFYLMAMWM